MYQYPTDGSQKLSGAQEPGPLFFCYFLNCSKNDEKNPPLHDTVYRHVHVHMLNVFKKGPIIVVTPLHAKVGGNGTPLIFWIPHCRQK